MKTIELDYLTEDQPISGQRYALISIVGPHMPQKCKVWGMKVRGVSDTIEGAKALSKKLMRVNQDFDIYTVDVGKFFPLVVDSTEIQDVEYQNSQLNALVKNYLENREMANEQWQTRKNEMMKEALREGKSQDEMANKPEHPIAVLQRIHNLESSVSKAREELQTLEESLSSSKDKFKTYTEEDKALAIKEFQSAVEQSKTDELPVAKPYEVLSLDDIRQQLEDDIKEVEEEKVTIEESSSQKEIDSILSELEEIQQEILELTEVKETVESISPNVFNRTVDQLQKLKVREADLKEKLKSKKDVNDYINSNFKNSKFDYLANL